MAACQSAGAGANTNRDVVATSAVADAGVSAHVNVPSSELSATTSLETNGGIVRSNAAVECLATQSSVAVDVLSATFKGTVGCRCRLSESGGSRRPEHSAGAEGASHQDVAVEASGKTRHGGVAGSDNQVTEAGDRAAKNRSRAVGGASQLALSINGD